MGSCETLQCFEATVERQAIGTTPRHFLWYGTPRCWTGRMQFQLHKPTWFRKPPSFGSYEANGGAVWQCKMNVIATHPLQTTKALNGIPAISSHERVGRGAHGVGGEFQTFVTSSNTANERA